MSSLALDAIGLAVIAALFGFTVFLISSGSHISTLLFFFVYLALSGVAIYVWHNKSSPRHPKQWAWWTLGSVATGALLFTADMVIGNFMYPNLPLLKAGTKVGGPLGFLATLAVCPGVTFVALAGLVRSLLASPERNSA